MRAGTSVPPPGSVRPKAPSVSPELSRGSHSPLLVLRAEPADRHRAERHGRLKGDGHRGVDARELLQGEAEGEVVAAHAAVLLGNRQPEQPHPPHLRDDVVRERAALVEVADHRRHHVAGEVLDGLAQRLVLVVEPVHAHSSSPAAAGCATAVSATASWASAVSAASPSPSPAASACTTRDGLGRPSLRGQPGAGLDQRRKVDAGLDAKPFEHPDQVLGGEVAGGALGVRAAAEPAGGGVHHGHPATAGRRGCWPAPARRCRGSARAIRSAADAGQRERRPAGPSTWPGVADADRVAEATARSSRGRAAAGRPHHLVDRHGPSHGSPKHIGHVGPHGQAVGAAPARPPGANIAIDSSTLRFRFAPGEASRWRCRRSRCR